MDGVSSDCVMNWWTGGSRVWFVFACDLYGEIPLLFGELQPYHHTAHSYVALLEPPVTNRVRHLSCFSVLRFLQKKYKGPKIASGQVFLRPILPTNKPSWFIINPPKDIYFIGRKKDWTFVFSRAHRGTRLLDYLWSVSPKLRM